MFQLNDQDRKRLETERNLWLATVRPDGSPHLVPIWFVWHENKAYLCTSANSRKAKNIANNPRVMFALEGGDDPVLIQATAKMLDQPPAEIIAAFRRKFDWDITCDSTYNAVIEIKPQRVVL